MLEFFSTSRNLIVHGKNDSHEAILPTLPIFASRLSHKACNISLSPIKSGCPSHNKYVQDVYTQLTFILRDVLECGVNQEKER